MTRESSKKILVDVVDDDKSIVNLVKMMLEPTGYRVRTAKSAKQKLKHIKKEQPSVLVTDVKMPGEDGIWLAQKVHEINPNIPCIVITGHGERDTLIDAFKANCFGFLDKPFAQKELVNTLSRAVELRQLRDTNEQLRAGYNEIIEKNSDGLVVVGKKGTIKYANKAFSKYICANSLSDIVGRLFVFPVKPGEAYRTEVRLKTGELLTVEIGTYDISWLGKSAYLVGMRDVTERVKAEKANLRVQEAEFSNRIKSQFLANMSHEIRTPLNAILGFSNMLEGVDDEARERCIEHINTSGDSLLELVNDILDLSKIESGQIDLKSESFDLKKILDNLIHLYRLKAKEKSIILSLNVHKSVPNNLLGDSGRIQQIFLNLVGNAMKFTDKGSITLTVATKKEKDNTKCILFSVKDTGPGIPSDKIDVIFDAFRQADGSSTRKHDGVGLGLNISQNLVKLMDGEIWVKSKEGEGTTFFVKMPLLEAVEDGKTSKRKSKGKKALKILLAEDNPLNSELIELFIENTPYELDVVPNGSEAVSRYLNRDYDLILMDLLMPVMDGFEAMDKIRRLEIERKKSSRLPIIALSALVMKKDVKKAMEHGCDAFLPKPIKPEDLLKTLETYFREMGDRKIIDAHERGV